VSYVSYLNFAKIQWNLLVERSCSGPDSERRHRENLQQIELIVVGFPGESDARLDARAHRDALQRCFGRALVEVPELLEPIDRCNGEIDDAQHPAWTRAGRVRRNTRQLNAIIPAGGGFSIRGADAVVDGAALLGGFAQAESLQGLREPYDNDAAFAIVALGRLHEKELLEFDGPWMVGGRLSQKSGVALVQGWNCGAEHTREDGRFASLSCTLLSTLHLTSLNVASATKHRECGEQCRENQTNQNLRVAPHRKPSCNKNHQQE
jgi:hypothetical protein